MGDLKRLTKILLFVFVVLCWFTGADDAIFMKAPPINAMPGITTTDLVLSTERQPRVKALLSKIAYPVGFVHVFPSKSDGCSDRVRLDRLANEHGCKFAINAGPFNMQTGACEGNIVSNGTVFQLESENQGYASWGMTRDGVHVFGDIGASTVDDADVVELVSGFVSPLLVDSGKPATSSSELVAQRQALGIDSSGGLLILTIDGAEDRNLGMNMTELASAFADLGAQYAVNLDGGGSTATWMDGYYINRPTCLDHLVPECDRAVASIICITA